MPTLQEDDYVQRILRIIDETGFCTQEEVDFEVNDIDEQHASVNDSQGTSEGAGQSDEKRGVNFSSAGVGDIASVLRRPDTFGYFAKETKDVAWDWVNSGYADIKTAHELAISGRTVKDFKNDLLVAQRDNDEIDWQCFKATFFDVGA